MTTDELNKIYTDVLKPYQNYMLKNNWYIAQGYFINGIRIKPFLNLIHYNNMIDDKEEAMKEAINHGIILDECANVIHLDIEQFYKTLYLWQAQELGIL